MCKILYIDDNDSLRKLFLCLGSEYHFEALTAPSIKEGYIMAEEHMPDAIITDINMPDGDGLTFTAKLKTNPKTASIPVVGCSVTYGDKAPKLFLVGGSKFVNDKPATIEKLTSILEGIIPFLNQPFTPRQSPKH